MPLYLTDFSIWLGARNLRSSYLPGLLDERLVSDEIATCVPVALEVLTGPANAADLDQDWEAVWRHLRWLPVGEQTMARALELLVGLAHTTAGGSPSAPDRLHRGRLRRVSREDVVLWYRDRDLTAICDFAGIPHEPEHARAKEHGINVEPGQN